MGAYANTQLILSLLPVLMISNGLLIRCTPKLGESGLGAWHPRLVERKLRTLLKAGTIPD